MHEILMLPIDRLDQIVSRFQFLEAKLNEELSGADIAKISREYSELRPVVDEISDYKCLLNALKEAEELLADPDMKALAEDEVANLKTKIRSAANTREDFSTLYQQIGFKNSG